MPSIYRLNVQPDADTNWSVSPGACESMKGFAPLDNGNVATVGETLQFSVTGDDALHAAIFPQTGGTKRFLVFRTANIDEYDSSAVRTNRGTGYTTASSWHAAAWGNQIIAVSKENATQSSTGAGFTALGGSSPKAKIVAANVNFVMMADVDDGGSNVYTDMVWWCGIRNPATWAPSQATQAGRVRLLDVPGPITALVAYTGKFIAFKSNAMFVGEYIGPPYVFSWRMVSNSIGCGFKDLVTECDGKLFFGNSSGVYMFDGQQITNIGQGVFSVFSWFNHGNPTAVADELEGVVWFCHFREFDAGGTRYELNPYGYNARTGLWAGAGDIFASTSIAGQSHVLVKTTRADFARFAVPGGALEPAAGFNYLGNGDSPGFYEVNYRDAIPTNNTAVITTGFSGWNDRSLSNLRAHLRIVDGVVPTISSAFFSAYGHELGSTGTTGTLTMNTELVTLDGIANGRFSRLTVTFDAGSTFEMAGIGFEATADGRR